MSKILEVIEEKIAASEKHSHCMMSGTTLLNEVNARLRVNGETEIGEDQFKEELKGLLKEQKIFFKKEYDEKIKYDGTYERVELKARSWFLNNAKLKEHEEKTVAYNKESREREEQKLVQKDRDVKKLSREAQAVYGTIKALTVEDNKAYVKTSEVQKKANMEFKEVQDAIKELRDNKISYMMKISRDFEKDTNGVKDNVHEEDWVITNSSKVLSKVIEREKIKEELNTAKNNDKEINLDEPGKEEKPKKTEIPEPIYNIVENPPEISENKSIPETEIPNEKGNGIKKIVFFYENGKFEVFEP